jgi:succinoglycan biosynthesis transport protein ExoP
MSNTTLHPQPAGPEHGVVGVDRLNLQFRYRRFLKMLARRWFILAGGALLGAGGGAWHALTQPDIYRAVSRIGVAPKLQIAQVNQAHYLEELKFFYDSQLQYLNSSEVLARVGQSLQQAGGAFPDPRHVTAKATKGMGFFNIVVESPDREYSRRYARIWAEEFIAFKDRLRGNALDKTAASTREELIRIEANLEKARAAVLAFQRQHNIGSVKETGDAAQARLDKLEAEYQDVLTLRQRLENKTKEDIANGVLLDSTRTLVDKPAAAGPAPGRAETADPLAKFSSESRYSELKLRLKGREAEWERHSATLKPRHPFMVELARDIEQRRLELQVQLDLIEEKRLARIRSLKDDEASYGPILAQLRRQVVDSRNIQSEYERLKEEELTVKALAENRRRALQSFELPLVDESLFTIIEAGTGPASPVGPDRARIILLTLAFGLALGLALVVFLDRLDDRYEPADEIKAALDQTVLGQVPEMPARERSDNRLLLTRLDEHSLFAESLRGVRSSLLLGFDDRPPKVLLVTSAVPGDGKTTFTVNFALTLARAGHRVLLVDADLRRGNTHRYFGHARGPGLTEILRGDLLWTDALHDTGHDQLFHIHTGGLPPDPGELLLRPITRRFLEDIRPAFDYIVFDCPPLTSIDDTFSLTGLADGLMFVVRAGRTSMRFARNALEALRHRGARTLGLIINGIAPGSPDYYYQHYYHSHYRAAAGAAASAPRRRRAAAGPAGAPATVSADDAEASRKLKACAAADQEFKS